MQISIANRWEMRVCCGTVTDRSLREIVGNHTFAGRAEPRPYAVHTVIRYEKTGKGLTERHIGRSLRKISPDKSVDFYLFSAMSCWALASWTSSEIEKTFC